MIKGRQDAYRIRVETQSRKLLDRGHLETANKLNDVLRPLKPDLKGFLRLLYPENPDRRTLPWEPRHVLPGEPPR